MPQVQFIDQPGLGSALGEFGSGMLGEYAENIKQQRQTDELQNALRQIKPGMEETDIMNILSGVRRTPEKELTSIADVYSKGAQRKREIQEQAKRSKLLAKDARGERLTEDELSMLKPEDIRGLQKAPPGGVSAAPVPPEVMPKIRQVLDANESANATNLEEAFQEAGVPKAHYSNYVESRRRQQEISDKPRQIKEELAIKRDAKILEDVDEKRSILPQQEADLNTMEESLNDIEFWTMNNLAETTGIELFRNARGGAYNTASKNYMIKNVQKFGARPNQWIEQYISNSLTKVGRSREANEASVEMLRFDHDISKKEADIVDRLEETGEYKPGSLGKKVQGEMKDYVEYRQKELARRLKELDKREEQRTKRIKKDAPEGSVLMVDNQGRNRYVPKDRVSGQKKKGWSLK